MQSYVAHYNNLIYIHLHCGPAWANEGHATSPTSYVTLRTRRPKVDVASHLFYSQLSATGSKPLIIGYWIKN